MTTDSRYLKYPEPKDCKFYESWCTDLEKSAIEYAVNQVDDDSGLYIEIGCFEGRSTVFTANLIHPKTLIAIDPWVPLPDAGKEPECYAARDIESIFRHNVKVGTAGNVNINKIKWEDYFASLEKKAKISYLYLDGPHNYDNVLKSLEIIVPHLAKGGVIIGDDYDYPPVKEAVIKYFGQDLYHPMSGRTFYYKNA